MNSMEQTMLEDTLESEKLSGLNSTSKVDRGIITVLVNLRGRLCKAGGEGCIGLISQIIILPNKETK